MKIGKTTFAAAAPRNLLLAAEKGYNAISGIHAVDITRWSDLKTVLRQLATPQAKELYDTVTFDTIGIFWELCEKYICSKHGVSNLSDIAWGAGYREQKEEFASALRQVTMLGFGLIMIAHADIRVEKSEETGEQEKISPSIPKRGYELVNQIADIIGYIGIKHLGDGKTERYLYTRSTPNIRAGSRFPFLEPVIPFGYESLQQALAKAILEQARIQQATLTDESTPMALPGRSFEEVRQEAQELWKFYISDENDIDKKEENKRLIMDIIKSHFGKEIRLSQVTPAHQEIYEMVVEDIKRLL